MIATTLSVLGVLAAVSAFAVWALLSQRKAWRLDVERIEYKTAAEGLAVLAVQEEASREAAEETLAEIVEHPSPIATSASPPAAHDAFARYLARRRRLRENRDKGGHGAGAGEIVRPDVGPAGVSGAGGQGERDVRPTGRSSAGLLDRLLGDARARLGLAAHHVDGSGATVRPEAEGEIE